MEIRQCLHTTVLVSDLAKAEQFYGTVLGLPNVSRSLNFPGVWYQIGAVQIHLIVDPTVQIPLRNPQKWGRNPHIAFSVTNLDEAKRQLLAHDYPIQTSASGRAALFTQDPDGNVIELSELAPPQD